jgi:hypothetical protein
MEEKEVFSITLSSSLKGIPGDGEMEGFKGLLILI